MFSPFQNATEYIGPDACGTQSWNLLDVDLPLSRTQDPGVTLAPLKPWTQYAVFVRAITLTTAEDSPHQGAQSPIIYLRTLPAGRLQPLKLGWELDAWVLVRMGDPGTRKRSWVSEPLAYRG